MRMQGSVETPWFDSAVLKGNLPGDPTERMIPVYLPPGYATSGRRYPVVYVLAGHGSSGVTYLNSPAWGESFPEKMDRLIASGRDGAGDRGVSGLLHHLRRGAVSQQLGARALRGLSRRGDHSLRRPHLPHAAGPGAPGDQRQEQRRLRGDGAVDAASGAVRRGGEPLGRHLLRVRAPAGPRQAARQPAEARRASRRSSPRSRHSSRRRTTRSGRCWACSATARPTRRTRRRRAGSTCRSTWRRGRCARTCGRAGWNGTRCG